MSLKDKLAQTDPEKVVENTTMNEVVKQTSKLPTSEQLAIASPAVKEELQIAQEQGQISPEESAQVVDNLANNKNKGGKLTKQFTGALKFLMPQMVGAAAGALAGGGSRGALGGAQLAGEAAKGYRDELREEKRLQLQADNMNQLMAIRNRTQATPIVHADTGEALSRDPISGQILDQQGNVVPPAKQVNLDFQREQRLQEQGSQRIALGEQRLRRTDKRIEQADRRIEEKEVDDYRAALKDLRARKPYQQAEEVLTQEPTIRALIEDAYINGGQSLSMLGPKIAKGIAGEVGVLTEADVTRYTRNPKLTAGIMDTYAKVTQGRITGESKENLLRMLDVMVGVAKQRKANMTSEEAELLSRREGISKKEAQSKIDVTAPRGNETRRQKLERLRKIKAGK